MEFHVMSVIIVTLEIYLEEWDVGATIAILTCAQGVRCVPKDIFFELRSKPAGVRPAKLESALHSTASRATMQSVQSAFMPSDEWNRVLT